MNHHLSLRTGAAVLASLALAGGVAACSGDDDEADTATTAGQQTQTVTQTATTDGQNGTNTEGQNGTNTTGQSGTSTTRPGQKEAVVEGEKATLESGDLKLTVQVDKLVDPLKTIVDTPREGNKLVGVFLTGKTSGSFEPTRVAATALLKTTGGNASVVRVISDGDCSGAFFPGGLLDEASDQQGCVGFEIPKDATPTAITIAVSSEGSKPDQETWELPKAQ